MNRRDFLLGLPLAPAALVAGPLPGETPYADIVPGEPSRMHRLVNGQCAICDHLYLGFRGYGFNRQAAEIARDMLLVPKEEK